MLLLLPLLLLLFSKCREYRSADGASLCNLIQSYRCIEARDLVVMQVNWDKILLRFFADLLHSL